MSNKKIKVERKLGKVPYCKVILRNMVKDEHGASFLYNGESIDIKSGEEVELKKEIVTHLQNLSIRKSRFEHPAGSANGVKVYYEEPRFVLQILKEYEKEEQVKIRKVIE